MVIFLLFFSSLHSTHCTYSRGGLIHFSCILLGLCWLWDVSLKNWRKLDSSLCIIVGAVCSLMLETTFTFSCGWRKSIFSIWLRVLMWLTSYDSCSSCSVINHKSKIHPKLTLPWDFKQWWALDSPLFLPCPPGLIRADESKNSTCALCTPQNVPQGDFFFSDTLFLYLLIPQFPSRTTDGSFCKWKMCFVLFFSGIPSL